MKSFFSRNIQSRRPARSFRFDMIIRHLFCALFFAVLASFSAHAQSGSPPATTNDVYRGNYRLEFSYTAPSSISLGSTRLGDLDTLHSRLNYTGTTRTSAEYSWRVGLDWDQFTFGRPAGAPIPSSVHGLSLNFGSDWRLNDRWSFQLGVRPGIYSDFADVTFQDFNAPFALMATYTVNPDLQFFARAGVNLRGEFPVIGGPGMRWRFTDRATLWLAIPQPRVEYELHSRLTLYAGGELQAGAYRVGENFGTQNGRPNLDHADLAYREIRAGAGVCWNVGKRLFLTTEAGWVIDRRIRFRAQHLQLNGDGAPYLQLGLNGSF